MCVCVCVCVTGMCYTHQGDAGDRGPPGDPGQPGLPVSGACVSMCLYMIQ